MDLQGRLSNPLRIAETLAAQGSQPTGDTPEDLESARIRASDNPSETPREAKERLSNPPQQRLSPGDVVDLIAAYRNGAKVSQLAADWDVHRHTITACLDRHKVERRDARRQWSPSQLEQARIMYAHGHSLATVGTEFSIDPTTVANRFRRAGISVRPRRGSTANH